MELGAGGVHQGEVGSAHAQRWRVCARVLSPVRVCCCTSLETGCIRIRAETTRRMCGKPSTPADRSQLSAAGAVQSDLERSRLARAARSESSSTCGLAVVLTPTRHRTITNARKTTQIDAPAPSSPAPPHPFPAGIHRARGLSGSRAPAINCVPRARACQEAKVVYRTRGSRDLSHDGIWRKHAVPTDRCWPSSGAAVVQHIGRLLFPLLQPRILGPRRTIRAA